MVVTGWLNRMFGRGAADRRHRRHQGAIKDQSLYRLVVLFYPVLVGLGLLAAIWAAILTPLVFGGAGRSEGPFTHPFTFVATLATFALLAAWRPVYRPPRAISIVGGLVCAFGAFKLLTVLTAGGWGWEWSLYQSIEAKVSQLVLGHEMARVGWNTALTLAMISGAALIRFRAPWGSIWLAAAAPVLPVSGLFGHLLGVQRTFGDMALSTIAILLPLCAAQLITYCHWMIFRGLLGRSAVAKSGRRQVMMALLVPVVVAGILAVEASFRGRHQLGLAIAIIPMWISVYFSLATLRAHAINAQQQTAHARQLAKLAVTDRLTGISNRAGVSLRAPQVDEMRDEQTFILLLDLDRFKSINDRFGHKAGDDVLVASARALKAGLRRADVLARWGGEEFLIVLTGITLEEAGDVAERVRRLVSEVRLPAFSGLRVTVSVGLSATAPGEATIEAAIGRADEALYQAKEAGRNRVIEAFLSRAAEGAAGGEAAVRGAEAAVRGAEPA